MDRPPRLLELDDLATATYVYALHHAPSTMAREGLTVWFTASLIVILGVVVALWLAESRRRERAIERDWELVLTPRGERQLNKFTAQVHDSLAVTDLTYARAREAHDRGDSEQARHLIDAGCELIGAYAPRMTNALAAMAALSRMAAAVTPVHPLRADRFQLSQLVQVAVLGGEFDQLVDPSLVAVLGSCPQDGQIGVSHDGQPPSHISHCC